MNSLSTKVKEKKSSISKTQKIALTNFMKNHPNLVCSKFTTKFTTNDARLLWIEVTDILNSMPGAKKNCQQWKKAWQDIKRLTKAKSKIIHDGTSHGQNSGDVLTKEDEEILLLIDNSHPTNNTTTTNPTSAGDMKTDQYISESVSVSQDTTTVESENDSTEKNSTNSIRSPPRTWESFSTASLKSKTVSNTEALIELSREKIKLKREFLALKLRKVQATERIAAVLETLLTRNND